MHEDRSPAASNQNGQENRPVTRRPALTEPPIPDVNWDDYEDVTPLAERTGIKYPVMLDHRIRSLLERDIDPVEFEENNHNSPLTIHVPVSYTHLDVYKRQG